MKRHYFILLIIVALSMMLAFYFFNETSSDSTSESSSATVYDFTVIDNQGNEVSLSQYRGKVLLIVNTATRCGHTPQYEELQQLYSVYKDQGFEILDFPCNQFAEQAPESDEEIQNFCTLNYHTEFPRFHKIDVNGENKIALYDYLEHANVDDPAADVSIGWNFTKFLVGKDGKVIRRFETDQRKDIIEPAIIDALK